MNVQHSTSNFAPEGCERWSWDSRVSAEWRAELLGWGVGPGADAASVNSVRSQTGAATGAISVTECGVRPGEAYSSFSIYLFASTAEVLFLKVLGLDLRC